MKMTATLGNPFLVFLYSLAILMFGCAIGVHWKATPCLAFCMTTIGAVLMVIHDLATGILGFWITARIFSHMSNNESR